MSLATLPRRVQWEPDDPFRPVATAPGQAQQWRHRLWGALRRVRFGLLIAPLAAGAAVRQVWAGLLAAPIAAGVAVLGTWLAVASVDPSRTTLLPCPLLSLTGIACPLCGGTRAAHALAHGELLDAAGYNILLLPAVPVAAALWARWVVRRSRGERVPFVALSPRLLTVAGAVLLTFAIVRNLPAGAWLFP